MKEYLLPVGMDFEAGFGQSRKVTAGEMTYVGTNSERMSVDRIAYKIITDLGECAASCFLRSLYLVKVLLQSA